MNNLKKCMLFRTLHEIALLERFLNPKSSLWAQGVGENAVLVMYTLMGVFFFLMVASVIFTTLQQLNS